MSIKCGSSVRPNTGSEGGGGVDGVGSGSGCFALRRDLEGVAADRDPESAGAAEPVV